MTDGGPLEAGSFSAWLASLRRAVRGDADSDVPCGGCTGCCRSSQFVHIGPDEASTLARIPKRLLFPAPRMPHGHVLLGYDERGHCPMLADGGCSIYEYRPRTCRTYDCRVFPAAAVAPENQPAVAEQAQRWRFDLSGPDDQLELDAVQAAATFLSDRDEALGDRAPSSALERALLAIELYQLFLGGDDESGKRMVVEPEPEAVLSVLGRRRRTQEPTT